MHPRCASCSAQPTEQGVTEADRKADGTAAAAWHGIGRCVRARTSDGGVTRRGAQPRRKPAPGSFVGDGMGSRLALRVSGCGADPQLLRPSGGTARETRRWCRHCGRCSMAACQFPWDWPRWFDFSSAARITLRLITTRILCPYFQKCHISFMNE